MNDEVFKHFDDYCGVFKLVNMAVNNQNDDVDYLNVNWNNVFNLSKTLTFVTLVKKGIELLCGENQPDETVKKAFASEFKKQVIIDSNQLYELELMKNGFEKNSIDMMLLKGSCIKNIYDETFLRYMGDIDTYVRRDDFDRANNVLTNLGYRMECDGGHDRLYIKEPFICLEQHFSLDDSKSQNIINYFETVWERGVVKSGYSHIYEMTPEDLYIYLSIHAIHHLDHAGIAPRIFLDYYVFLEKYNNSLNMEYINRTLEEFGYREFDKIAVSLAYRWFGKNGTGLDKNNKLDLFVASCSAYGTVEHNVGIRTAKMVADGEKASKLTFLLKQLFPAYDHIQMQFPVLKKCPLLLPVVWVVYIVEKVRNAKTIRYYKNINNETAEQYNEIISELGLANRND